jgi:hypothetical protein
MAPTATGQGIKLHSADYYGKCMVGGVLACGVTHAAVVSLDVVRAGPARGWGPGAAGRGGTKEQKKKMRPPD